MGKNSRANYALVSLLRGVLELFAKFSYHSFMFLFLCLLFPLGFFIWTRTNEDGALRFLPSAFLGVFVSAVFCAFRFFFLPFYYLPQDSFLRNFFYVFCNYVFAPLLAMAVLCFLLERRGDFFSRFENFFPICAGFYAIYLPFRILNGRLPIPFFLLFAKPVICFSMILAASKILVALFEKRRTNIMDNSKKIFLSCALAFTLLLPAVLEAAWMVGANSILTVILTLAYLAAAAIFSVIDK
ncbi:MAG: hypothetical protein K2I95_04550 [Treponemataceae bacterium]|nr:hypothetical protein [Treponemataceae bacterium]